MHGKEQMTKLTCYIPVKPITAIIIGIMLVLGILVSSICTTSEGMVTPSNDEGFAIYLTKQDIPPAQMKALSHVNLTDQPIISIKDIITYNAQTHEIKLTDEAFERIYQLDVSTGGKSFIVCVDKAPIYWGAFWTPISSISFDGVTIWKPYSSQGPTVITLQLGYPSSSFYGGEDPRSNPVVIESLEQAGKLINEPSITSSTGADAANE
jgi:hypothetical protein